MLVQDLKITDPSILRQAFCQVITGDVIPTSSKGCPCSIGYRFLSPNLSLIWGSYSHLSGTWHTLGGVYVSISVDETPFFFKGNRVGLLENPLEVTLTYNHQEIDYSFTHPYRSLVLYIESDFFAQTYQSLWQKPFDQRRQANMVNFQSQRLKDSLVNKLLPLSYHATQDNLHPLEGLEISEEIVEQLILSLEFEEPIFLNRTCCQSLALKAHELLLSKPQERVTLSDITRELKAPLRSIQKGFQELYGLSPMEYHQRYRLLQLRSFILQHGPEKIAEAGRLFGFHHAGRLSKLYKESFHVLPSQDYGIDTAAEMVRQLGVAFLPAFD